MTGNVNGSGFRFFPSLSLGAFYFHVYFFLDYKELVLNLDIVACFECDILIPMIA